jgi:hypothetical protein
MLVNARALLLLLGGPVVITDVGRDRTDRGDDVKPS